MESEFNSTGDAEVSESRFDERGAGVVEWLGISALAVTLLVGLFGALTDVGDQLIAEISGQLGL